MMQSVAESFAQYDFAFVYVFMLEFKSDQSMWVCPLEAFYSHSPGL